MRKAGDRVPAVTFRVRNNNDWEEVTTADLFDNKTVVLFALPGAFTPTCSTTHLPGYMSLSEQIRSQGVDDILCLSVNDSFVMNAWARDQLVVEELRMVPDGNGHFSKAMGLLVDKENLGFGMRSWRYSMLVVNGVIEKMFVEDFNTPGDPFEVSDAMAMLAYVTERNKARASG